MSRRWWILGDGMEEISFKRVPEGWLFAAPFLWARRSTYLVGDALKAELEKRLRWMWRINFLVIMVATGVLMPLLASRRPMTEWWMALAVLIAAVIGLATAYASLAIRPLLAGVPPTSMRISRTDAFRTQAATYSSTAILLLGLCSLALFAGSIFKGLTSSWDSLTVVAVLLFGATAVYFPVLLVAKRRMARRSS
jgi:hypothetical protein